ncbi:heavy-metal-associated domain-containing protein [Helicobacter sp.]|uniref:heavy-metal-associated domain-containing protein n=1 Tax=Helicobacter sp. TaxID=218 RepID=UPI0025BBC999|nr:heavy metal-associated domain-containing protein [Helicobacter sp.]MCI5968631.1 heavy-metal-associated domain-containing protein [Helicobacter sp.]MDY2584454.1 heavy metal-associated domain-containing protein [Helicobacter sp.]
MQKIQCQNIKCEGCVKKINDALLGQYPSLRVNITTQIVEVEAKESELNAIRAKLRELGFLASDGIFNKFKSFYRK